MDIFTSLVQTCKKLGLSAYAYFRDRLSRRHELPSLAAAIRSAASAAALATPHRSRRQRVVAEHRPEKEALRTDFEPSFPGPISGQRVVISVALDSSRH